MNVLSNPSPTKINQIRLCFDSYYTPIFIVCLVSVIDLFLLHKTHAKVDIFVCNLDRKIRYTLDT